MATGIESGKVVEGPSVISIGWIPHLKYLDAIPPAFANHPKVKALTQMLRTGNVPPPPSSFGGLTDFKSYIKARNYRSIVGFHDVRIQCDGNGFVVGVPPHQAVSEVGYTPIEARFDSLSVSLRVGHHDIGEGRLVSSVGMGSGQDHLQLARTVRFRVGKIGNYFAKRWIGHYAPFASAECIYGLYCDGDCEYQIYGTCIPNQTLYINWQAVGHYSMAEITAEQLDDFLTAVTKRVNPEVSLLFSRNKNANPSSVS